MADVLASVGFVALCLASLGGMIGAWFVPGGPLRTAMFCGGVVAMLAIAMWIER